MLAIALGKHVGHLVLKSSKNEYNIVVVFFFKYMNDEFILPLVLSVLLLVQIRKKHLYITNYINNFAEMKIFTRTQLQRKIHVWKLPRNQIKDAAVCVGHQFLL